jgi:hypothetical protein
LYVTSKKTSDSILRFKHRGCLECRFSTSGATKYLTLPLYDVFMTTASSSTVVLSPLRLPDLAHLLYLADLPDEGPMSHLMSFQQMQWTSSRLHTRTAARTKSPTETIYKPVHNTPIRITNLPFHAIPGVSRPISTFKYTSPSHLAKKQALSHPHDGPKLSLSRC